ncbi:MAG: ADP-ribosylglycohydrolase family protein [Acutalibacteraceae bacterium]
MYGALIGDIIGSTYEWHNVKTEDFDLFPVGSHFTDDTVLSVATADTLLSSCSNIKKQYALKYKQFYSRYPYAGFGQMFIHWAENENLYIQKSYGNGAAMRVVAIGYAFESLDEVLKQVKYSCYYTHHHKEAIKCAQAVAAAVFMAYHGENKQTIQTFIEKRLSIPLNFTLDEIRNNYAFNSRAMESVPQAIVAFLESESYESAIRKAVSIGGDSDTIACIAGGIAEAYYKTIPDNILKKGKGFLEQTLKNTVNTFYKKYHLFEL